MEGVGWRVWDVTLEGVGGVRCEGWAVGCGRCDGEVGGWEVRGGR